MNLDVFAHAFKYENLFFAGTKQSRLTRLVEEVARNPISSSSASRVKHETHLGSDRVKVELLN